jgi:hypothetical protein
VRLQLEKSFTKFDIWGFFEILSENTLWLISDKNNGNVVRITMCIYDNNLLNSSYNKKYVKNALERVLELKVYVNIVSFMSNVKKYGSSRQATD